MALTAKSLFLYGFQITNLNSSLDFQSVSMGPVKQATLTQGFYSLSSLLIEIKRAMQAVDSLNTYTVTADRTISSGTQNRVTIYTSGSFLSLLLGTGPRITTSCATLIGFTATDKTGFTTYTGTLTAGTALLTEYPAYTFIPTEMDHQVFGSSNISASGVKEVVSFQIQQFWSGEFKYEPEAKVKVQWLALMDWLIQGRLFDFTPEVTSPTVFYEGTLEKHPRESKGLGYNFKEMLPNFPFNYQTGIMTFRLNIT